MSRAPLTYAGVSRTNARLLWPVDPHTYALYLGTMAAMAATPGPANVFAIASGIERGPKAAFLVALGMNCATLVWYAGAALGLMALAEAFPLVFKAAALAGAAYVGWLGAQSIWAGVSGTAEGVKRTSTKGRTPFLGGFAIQISNPKIVLFFSAMLPPFLEPARPIAPQLGAFALATVVLDYIAMTAYGLAGAALSRAFERAAFRRGFAIFVGLLLTGVAALILLRLLG